MMESTALRWLFGAIVVAAIVALLAWARNDAGVDDRDPDPPSSTEVVTDQGTVPPQDTPVVTTGDTEPPTT